MIQYTQSLIEEIDMLKNQLGRKTAELNKLQEDCEHNWDIILYEPIVTEKFSMTTGCTDTTTRKTWSRTCTLCGFKDIAYNVTKKKVEGMYPGTTAEIEVPMFVDKEKVKKSSLLNNLRLTPYPDAKNVEDCLPKEQREHWCNRMEDLNQWGNGAEDGGGS